MNTAKNNSVVEEDKILKNFYNLLGNTVISGITNMTVWSALVFYIYLQTQTVLATGIISGLYLAAISLSGFWMGSIVDHHKKKNIMLISSILSLLMYIVGFIFYKFIDPTIFTNIHNPFIWCFVLILLVGVLSGNLRGIALPTIVTLLFPQEKRDKINGLVGSTTGITFLVVSVISGFLVAQSGMFLVLLLAILTTILSIIHLWFIPIPEENIVSSQTNMVQKVDIKGTIKVIQAVPGLFALIFFATFNNFLGGVFAALMDAYGLSLVSVQVWGILWGALSLAFIIGGLAVAKIGLGKNPLRTLLLANVVIWGLCSVFTLKSSIVILMIGLFLYLCIAPAIEASEQTVLQKVVPPERQGRVFGFAQSIEQIASPLTSFLIGPLTQFIFIPFMTVGTGAKLIGGWYGTGPDRGISIVFTIAGLIGLTVTLIAMRTKFYRQLSEEYLRAK